MGLWSTDPDPLSSDPPPDPPAAPVSTSGAFSDLDLSVSGVGKCATW